MICLMIQTSKKYIVITSWNFSILMTYHQLALQVDNSKDDPAPNRAPPEVDNKFETANGKEPQRSMSSKLISVNKGDIVTLTSLAILDPIQYDLDQNSDSDSLPLSNKIKSRAYPKSICRTLDILQTQSLMLLQH